MATFKPHNAAQGAFDFTGKELAKKGLEQAVTNADAKNDKWSARACSLAERWIGVKPVGTIFLIEDIRSWAEETCIIEDPPSKTAWGVVSKHIVKKGLAKMLGRVSCKNPKGHAGYLTQYEKL